MSVQLLSLLEDGRPSEHLIGLAQATDGWAQIAERLWRLRLGWPSEVRQLATQLRERTILRGSAADTARVDLVLLELRVAAAPEMSPVTTFVDDHSRVLGGADDARWLGLAELHRARSHMRRGDYAECAAAMLAWEHSYAAAADLRDVGWALGSAGLALLNSGAEEEGFAACYRGLECLRNAEPGPELALTLMNTGVLHLRFGNFRTSELLLEEAVAVVRSLQCGALLVRVTANLASCALYRGDVAQAMSLLESDLAAADSNAEPVLGLVRASALRRSGRLVEARSQLDRALARVDDSPHSQLSALARIASIAQLREEGRLDEALALLADTLAYPPGFITHIYELNLFEEASALHAARGEWEMALSYERLRDDRELATQRHSARAEYLGLQVRHALQRHRLERDHERRRCEDAEASGAHLAALNEKLEARANAIKQAEAALRAQALRDELTGLHNRRFLDEMLPRELAQASIDGQALSLALLDIDRLRYFNDSHGLEFGDQLLCSFAALLRRHLRSSDVCCRFGGEEFCLVLPRATLSQAVARVELMLAEAQQLLVPGKDGKAVRGFSFSAGIAQCGLHGLLPEAVIAAADRALLSAKAAGRARVQAAMDTR